MVTAKALVGRSVAVRRCADARRSEMAWAAINRAIPKLSGASHEAVG